MLRSWTAGARSSVTLEQSKEKARQQEAAKPKEEKEQEIVYLEGVRGIVLSVCSRIVMYKLTDSSEEGISYGLAD
jgi:hypothetical protein